MYLNYCKKHDVHYYDSKLNSTCNHLPTSDQLRKMSVDDRNNKPRGKVIRPWQKFTRGKVEV